MSTPKFCWHCQRKLVFNKMKLIFSLVKDPLGNEHRVHKICVPDSISEGNKEVKQ